MSLWVGQTSDICAKPVAKTRQSNHTSRHTSNRPCSLIFRTTPHFSPDFITIADPLPDPPSLFAPRACLSRVHSRFRSAARLSPIFPSRPLRSCTCSLSYLASALLISIVRSATVYQYTECKYYTYRAMRRMSCFLLARNTLNERRKMER